MVRLATILSDPRVHVLLIFSQLFFINFVVFKALASFLTATTASCGLDVKLFVYACAYVKRLSTRYVDRMCRGHASACKQ